MAGKVPRSSRNAPARRACTWCRSASCLVRDALDEFLAGYGFTRSDYSAKSYWIDFFGLRVVLPNPKSRRVMVPLHDLHHLATGYGADLASEAEIAAWELRAGCTSWMLWLLNLSAAALGLVIAPRRTVRAFRAGRGAATLYRLSLAYEEALGLTLGDLRQRMGIPESGLSSPAH